MEREHSWKCPTDTDRVQTTHRTDLVLHHRAETPSDYRLSASVYLFLLLLLSLCLFLNRFLWVISNYSSDGPWKPFCIWSYYLSCFFYTSNTATVFSSLWSFSGFSSWFLLVTLAALWPLRATTGHFTQRLCSSRVTYSVRSRKPSVRCWSGWSPGSLDTYLSRAAPANRNAKAAAANINVSWQHDGSPACRVMGNWLCLASLTPVSETTYSPSTTPLLLTPFLISECPTAGRRTPDRSLVPTTLQPHCQTSMETTPPLGRLLSC